MTHSIPAPLSALRWREHINEKHGVADLRHKLCDSMLLHNIFGSDLRDRRVPLWPNPMVVTWTSRKSLSAKVMASWGCRGAESRKAVETQFSFENLNASHPQWPAGRKPKGSGDSL